MRFSGLLLLFSLLLNHLQAQPRPFRVTEYHAEIGSYYSTSGQTPFWLRTNQFGVVPLDAPLGVVRAGVRSDYRQPTTKRKPIDVGYGLDVVGNAPGRDWQVLVPEAYVKLRLWPLEVSAGRRREVYGLVDTLLSSGSFAWSGNALPLPKFQISIPEYWPAQAAVSFKGNFAHGFFENSRPYVKNAFLHQKSLYVRLGRPTGNVRFYGGFTHQVMWGGESPFYSTDGKLPSNWQAYKRVVTGRSVAGDSTMFGNTFDGGNRVGNHLGNVDVGTEFTVGGSSIFLYRQSFFEDGSLFYLTNISDGLSGLRWQNLNTGRVAVRLQRITAEYLNTTSQGGNIWGDDPRQRGRDNYFNHPQYLDGWSYFGRTLGTPFITPNAELGNRVGRTGGFTSNNRVQVAHLGLSGTVGQATRLEGKVSYSWNRGTYDGPFFDGRTQLSAYLRCATDLNVLDGIEVSGAVGYDQGSLFNNSLGFNLRLRKTWKDSARRLAVAKPQEESKLSVGK